MWWTSFRWVCVQVFGRYGTVVLSVLSVTLVYRGQTAGRIKMSLGTKAGLSPGDIVLDGDPAPPRKGAEQPPTFLPMFVVAKRSLIWATAEPLFRIITTKECLKWVYSVSVKCVYTRYKARRRQCVQVAMQLWICNHNHRKNISVRLIHKHMTTEGWSFCMKISMQNNIFLS